MKYKTLEEIQKNPVWIKLQSDGTSKENLDKQFLSLTQARNAQPSSLSFSSRHVFVVMFAILGRSGPTFLSHINKFSPRMLRLTSCRLRSSQMSQRTSCRIFTMYGVSARKKWRKTWSKVRNRRWKISATNVRFSPNNCGPRQRSDFVKKNNGRRRTRHGWNERQQSCSVAPHLPPKNRRRRGSNFNRIRTVWDAQQDKHTGREVLSGVVPGKKSPVERS